jgi:hypothetical protein
MSILLKGIVETKVNSTSFDVIDSFGGTWITLPCVTTSASANPIENGSHLVPVTVHAVVAWALRET